MRFGYSCLNINISKYSKQLMVAAGLLVLPFSVRFEKLAFGTPAPSQPRPTPPIIPETDPRTIRLQSFFGRLHCPIFALADEFIHAADENRLDWRLLPSISVIESGGGKAFHNNNIFGWNNGAQLFPSIRSGIREVAFRLGRSPLYRNHDSAGKLMVYNSNNREYTARVMDVMRKISPVANIKPVRNLTIRVHRTEYARN